MALIQPLEVRVTWDDGVKVWIATSDDIPGLCAQANTLEELVDVVSDLAPELLELNGVILSAPAVPIHITAERTATVRLPE